MKKPSKKSNGKRKKNKQYTRRYMDQYINKNIDSAFRKLKYMKKLKYYNVSQEAQTAYSSLRTLYRRLDLNENVMHKSKKFRSMLTSNADVAVLFRAINDIMSIKTRPLRDEYNRVSKEFEAKGVKFDEVFDTLSLLSSEFHEVFAFLTYNEAQNYLKDGDASTMLDLLSSARRVYKDPYFDLDDKQQGKADILENKMKEKLDNYQLNKVIKNSRMRRG